MATTIDDVMLKIGEFRRYQWYLLTVTGYTVITVAAFPIMIVSFITAEPDWECVEGYMNNTICRFNKSITLTSDDYNARCNMPREAWTFVGDFNSAVTEYDLVCDDSILLSIAQSCYWVGMLISLLIGGVLADQFGRKIIWYSGCATIVVATLIMVFPKAFVVFIVCRIFIGLGSGFRNGTSFPLLTEFTTEKYRSWMGIGSFVFWAAGISVLPLIGYLVPAWRIFLLITSVTSIPCIVCWWLVLESPRWLLLNNKEDEAKAVLAKMARMNKRSLPQDLVLQKPVVPEKRVSFLQLFNNRKTAITTLISWDLWFATSLVYYGVSYGSVDLGGNRYLNVFLVSVVELPSDIAIIWSAGRFGRKKSVIIGLVIALVASAISVAIPTNKSSASVGGRVTAAIIAKFFINFSFSGIYLWSTELFPTEIRITAVSTSSAMARVGSFGASYIIWLIRIHAALPYGIMGAVCLQAAILGLFLPETKGAPTLETMDDMKKRKNQKDQGIALLVNDNDKADKNGNESEF